MTLRQAWLPVALGGLTNGLIADDAAAHVKWFCAFDVAGQPRNLENVLCPNFELLAGAAILVCWSAARSNVRVWAKVCSAPWIGCSVTCSSKPS